MITAVLAIIRWIIARVKAAFAFLWSPSSSVEVSGRLSGSVVASEGLEVVLHSLSTAELNGTHGTIVSTGPNEKGRWVVKLPQKEGEEAKTVNAKLANLIWDGRHVQIAEAENEPEFSGVPALVKGDKPDSDGKWTVEARKKLRLKPNNLEVEQHSQDKTLQQGAQVKVFGLQAKPVFNGLSGVVQSKIATPEGRWEVEVAKILAVKLNSLKMDIPWAGGLFGEQLQTKSGMVSTSDALAGKKAVLVYFSAHWCPPCKAFTPVLADAYRKCVSRDVEVIFVSSDRDAASFEEYYKEMPWAALPFSDRSRQSALSTKFSVQGIPSLVVLRGADGSIASANARGEVQSTGDLSKCLAMWGC
eukprot:TRINITY_DN43889_c0_g1_i1.p1 TRINITY_DN43889_c0_g1~~TRINITY_DN43889_c0_g1_i1.p1  ORF type:complete len:391 (-),score=60.99 TRINITY_DN43889_c0_g1_i1:189-1265(-)